jgi:hypothetical protein
LYILANSVSVCTKRNNPPLPLVIELAKTGAGHNY